MAGDWFVQEDGEGDYAHFSTYNTAANSLTEMWIDDLETFWPMKGKIAVDQANKTFSGTNIANAYQESTFTITEGKIIKGAAKAPGSRAVTDSIIFKVEFSDDDEPGIIHTFSGYKRTGFREDEH